MSRVIPAHLMPQRIVINEAASDLAIGLMKRLTRRGQGVMLISLEAGAPPLLKLAMLLRDRPLTRESSAGLGFIPFVEAHLQLGLRMASNHQMDTVIITAPDIDSPGIDVGPGDQVGVYLNRAGRTNDQLVGELLAQVLLASRQKRPVLWAEVS